MIKKIISTFSTINNLLMYSGLHKHKRDIVIFFI